MGEQDQSLHTSMLYVLGVVPERNVPARCPCSRRLTRRMAEPLVADQREAASGTARKGVELPRARGRYSYGRAE